MLHDRKLLVLIGFLLAFVVANLHVTNIKRKRIEAELQIAFPAPVQLILAGGDRYLAANIGTFRAVTVGVFQLKPETYKVLATIQRSAAQLNPRHEDNYYTAAAILAWNEETAAAQEILAAAREARPTDALPAFFYAFNRFYFYHDPVDAAKEMQVAAARSQGANRAALTDVAARWYQLGEDPAFAVTMIRNMAVQTRDQELKRLLQARVVRLEGLITLRNATKQFTADNGRPPGRLEELVDKHHLASIPVDPLGIGYSLDKTGQPILNRRPVQNSK